MKAKLRVAKIVCWSALLIGGLFVLSGIKGMIELKIASRDYATTEGYFFDYEIYSKGGYDAMKRRHTNDTYRLLYRYQVNGQEYTVSTDMGEGSLPDYGSVKDIRYNPDDPNDAFISGPNRHLFKIFFGLFFIAIPSFFIWLLKPKEETEKKRQTSMDRVGAAIGLLLMFFSYGMLFFITGEYSITGIIRFYMTSFMLPMIAPVLLIAAGGYLFIRSLFFRRNGAALACETEDSLKGKGRNRIVGIVVGILLLAVTVGSILANRNINQPADERMSQAGKNAMAKADFTMAHTILKERDFETANIETTYWVYDEEKLRNVVSGVKGDTIFEFYEYTDGETTDGVYQRISEDISDGMDQKEREKYETKLPGGGQRLNVIKDGVDSVVMYEDNIVIYAHSPAGSHEIQDILAELGYRDR